MIKTKFKLQNSAVSEVLDTILLLGIAVGMFTILSFVVLTFPFDPSSPATDIIGYLDGDDVVLAHNGGEALSLDTEIIIRIDSELFNSYAGDNLTYNSTINNLRY